MSPDKSHFLFSGYSAVCCIVVAYTMYVYRCCWIHRCVPKSQPVNKFLSLQNIHCCYLLESCRFPQNCPHFTVLLNNDCVSEAICQIEKKLQKMIMFCLLFSLQTSHLSSRRKRFAHISRTPTSFHVFVSPQFNNPTRDGEYELGSLGEWRLIMLHDHWQGWRGIKDLTLGEWRQYQPLSARWPSHNRPLVLFFSSNQLEVLGSHYLRLSCIGFLPRSIILKPFFAVRVWSLTILGQPVKSDFVCVSLSPSLFGPLDCY